MRIGFLFSVLIFLLLAVAPAAIAQDPQPGKTKDGPAVKLLPLSLEQTKARLAQYAGTAEHEKQIYKGIVGLEQAFRGVCNSIDIKERRNRQMLEPARFVEGLARPVSGVWRERWLVERCDKQILHNLTFIAQPGRSPQVAVMLPGTTQASLDLQNNTAVGLVASANKANKKCQKHLVADTRVTAQLAEQKLNDKKMLIGGYWLETWAMWSCGQLWAVKLRFEYQPDGSLLSKIEG